MSITIKTTEKFESLDKLNQLSLLVKLDEIIEDLNSISPEKIELIEEIERFRNQIETKLNYNKRKSFKKDLEKFGVVIEGID